MKKLKKSYEEERDKYALNFNYIDLLNSTELICVNKIDEPTDWRAKYISYNFNFTLNKKYKIVEAVKKSFPILGDLYSITLIDDNGENVIFRMRSDFGDCFCTIPSFEKNNIVSDETREDEIFNK